MAYRRGIVKEVGTGQWNGYVRVRWPERDNAVSWWLSVSTRGTQGTKEWWVPPIGEQVNCDIDDRGEDGCVIGSVWSTEDAPNPDATPTQRRTDYSDGSSVIYDEASHTFTISIVAGGTDTIGVAGGASMVFGSGGTLTMTDPSGTSLELANNGKVLLTGELDIAGGPIKVNGTIVTVP